MTFSKKAGKSLIWSFLDNIALRGLSFVVILLLTRLLSPEDFGLVGILQIVIVLGNALVDGGFGQSIIRDENSDDTDFSTVFFLTLIISLVLYGIVFYSAPFIASYFENEILIDLIRVYTIVFILAPFSLIQKTILMKKIDFKRIFILNAPGSVVGGAIAIYMAYSGYGVWSIIGLHVSTHFFRAIFMWFGSPWKPHFVFSIPRLKYHFDFGSKIVASSILGSLFRELYTVIIAKSFSIVSLGYYTRAKTYSLFPMSISSDVISKATYPILSQIKGDNQKISAAYQSIMRATFFVLAPLMFTMAATAEPLFEYLFTEKWLPAVPYFRILALSSVLYPIHELNITIFKIYGKTGLFLRLNMMRQGLVIIAVFVGIYTSLQGLLWAVVGISFVALFINTHYSDKMINYSTMSQLKDMSKIMASGLLSALLAFSIDHFFLGDLHLLIRILATCLASLASYLLINILTKNKSYFDSKRFAKTIYLSLRNR